MASSYNRVIAMGKMASQLTVIKPNSVCIDNTTANPEQRAYFRHAAPSHEDRGISFTNLLRFSFNAEII